MGPGISPDVMCPYVYVYKLCKNFVCRELHNLDDASYPAPAVNCNLPRMPFPHGTSSAVVIRVTVGAASAAKPLRLA